MRGVIRVCAVVEEELDDGDGAVGAGEGGGD